MISQGDDTVIRHMIIEKLSQIQFPLFWKLLM